MAYAATVTTNLSGNVNGRQTLVVTVVETEAASASEYSFSVPFLVGTIASLKATRTAGTGTTIQPMIGTATGVAVSTQAREYQAPAAAAHQREAPMRSFYGPTLYVRSTPNSAVADHSITSEWIITAGINDSQDVSADSDLTAIAASVATSATQNTTTATNTGSIATSADAIEASATSMDTKLSTSNTNTGSIATSADAIEASASSLDTKATTTNTELARLTGGKLVDQGGATVSIGTSSGTVWTYNANAKLLVIANTHASNVLYLSADGGNAATTDLPVWPQTNQVFQRGEIPSATLKGIASGASTTVNVIEYREG